MTAQPRPKAISTEARLNSLITNWMPLAVYKAGDTARTSTTTLANDPDLVIAVGANTSYQLDALIVYTASSGGDIKWSWTIPAGAALLYQCLHNEGGATGLNNSAAVNTAAFTGFSAGSGATTNNGLGFAGSLTTAGSGGSLQFQWAQNTSSGTATTVRAGSGIVLIRTL